MSTGQKLLTIRDDDKANCFIRRGKHAKGYYLVGQDKILDATFSFPINQDDVAKYFKENGRLWVKE